MDGAKRAVLTLEQLGVDVVFGHPGGAVLPLYDALHASSMRHVLARHEQMAAHMADGYARMSLRTGVCIATSGPGATNLVTGVATAHADSSPVLALTGQVATSVLGTGAFQEVDAFDLFMPIVKHNWRLDRAGDIDPVLREAHELTRQGRYGPTHVDLPLDVQRAEVAESSGESAMPSAPAARSPDPARINDALQLLEQSEAPVLLLGGGVHWSRAQDDILELATALAAPIVTTLPGKGSVPDDHPLALGVVGMHGKMVATYVLNNADTILALGTRFSDRSTGKTEAFGRRQRIIHMDPDASELGKNVPGVAEIAGELRMSVRLLREGLRSRFLRRNGAWQERVRLLRKNCECAYDLAGRPLLPQRVVWELNRALSADAVLTTEVGRHQMWAEHFFEASAKRRFITSAGLGTMGFGLPAAIGAKLAAPERFILDLAGDGSLQINMKELATARENKVPVTVLVMNDGYLGMVQQWQQEFYGGRLKAVELGKRPDFVKLADAYGCDATRVERTSHLEDALRAATRSEVPFLIDVPVDAREHVLPMVPPGKTYRDAILGTRCTWKEVTRHALAPTAS